MRRLWALALALLLLTGCAPSPEPTAPPTAAASVPTEPSVTAEDCQALARELSRKYGILILVDEDVLLRTPWDYDLEPETEPQRIEKGLQKLDRWLSVYPEGMLQTLARETGGLYLSLVRGIFGKEVAGTIGTASGLQFEDQGRHCIALTMGPYSQYTLYHELFHIMESYIQQTTQALDHWERLNPPDFSYDYDFDANRMRDGSPWLQPGTRSFIDTYSMVNPSEDRARIIEYAMISGSGPLFASPAMQAKLLRLSQAIREAFGLQQSGEIFPWEQYLQPAKP